MYFRIASFRSSAVSPLGLMYVVVDRYWYLHNTKLRLVDNKIYVSI